MMNFNNHSMAFPHVTSSSDQQYFQNFYNNTQIRDKSNDFQIKNHKLEYTMQQSDAQATSVILNEPFRQAAKDSENSKRFSVNNLLKLPSAATMELSNGKHAHVVPLPSEVIKTISTIRNKREKKNPFGRQAVEFHLKSNLSSLSEWCNVGHDKCLYLLLAHDRATIKTMHFIC